MNPSLKCGHPSCRTCLCSIDISSSLILVIYWLCRYQQEQREQREADLKLEKEQMEVARREKLEEESVLRDKLIKNVRQLEQRKMEVQRELLLRSLTSDGQSQLKSAVVIPDH